MRLLPLALFAGPARGLVRAAHLHARGYPGRRPAVPRELCFCATGRRAIRFQGIDLGHGRFRQTYSENALVKIIQNGIPGTGMPSNNLQDFQAEIVVAYLRSIATSGRAATGNGDAARGKAIFEGKGNCTSCHRVNGAGSRVGPDLSDIGGAAPQRRRSSVRCSNRMRKCCRRTVLIARSRRQGETDHGAAAQRRYFHGADSGFEGAPALAPALGFARVGVCE